MNPFPDIFSQMAMLLFAVAVGALAALGVMLGFSKEVGAFVAGVSLVSTPYRNAHAHERA